MGPSIGKQAVGDRLSVAERGAQWRALGHLLTKWNTAIRAEQGARARAALLGCRADPCNFIR